MFYKHIYFIIMKNYIYFIFAFMIVSCKSTQPMTNRIDRTASMVGKIDNFQYYVSRNIVLTKRNKTDIRGEVSVSGKLSVSYNKDVIQITTATEGALLNTTINNDNYKIYHVAFEADNDNCLKFVQKRNGDEEFLYLLFDYPDINGVKYGNDIFIVQWDENSLNKSKLRAKIDNKLSKIKGNLKGVTFDENDYPYLLVKMTTKIKENENYRKASGRKVVVEQ